ncbi:MAG: hypothetical protein ACFFEV_09520 [Candidatus Thorarchaeota archaeon]
MYGVQSTPGTASPIQGVGVCLAIVFGLMFAIMGFTFYFMIGDIMPPFASFFLAMIAIGLIAFFVGAAKVPSVRREQKNWRKILEIAAVRKEVSISDISYETGFDSEYIRKVLTQCLMSGYLFGYIEDDLFVRDTAGRPGYYPGRMGLGGVSD